MDFHDAFILPDTLNNRPEIKQNDIAYDRFASVVTMESLLTRYVDMAIEQSQRVLAMHAEKCETLKTSHEAVSNAVSHSEEMKDFARKAMHHPEIIATLEKLDKVPRMPVSLRERGGLSAIRSRIEQGKWVDEDKRAILSLLRNNARDESLIQAQARDRGGRKR